MYHHRVALFVDEWAQKINEEKKPIVQERESGWVMEFEFLFPFLFAQSKALDRRQCDVMSAFQEISDIIL